MAVAVWLQSRCARHYASANRHEVRQQPHASFVSWRKLATAHRSKPSLRSKIVLVNQPSSHFVVVALWLQRAAMLWVSKAVSRQELCAWQLPKMNRLKWLAEEH